MTNPREGSRPRRGAALIPAPSVFVFSPRSDDDGPAPTSNVFVDFGACYAALREAAGRGRCVLQFDGTYQDPVIPAGAYDMTDVVWTSANYPTFLTLEDGVSITTAAGTSLVIDGALFVISDRVGDTPPFDGIDIVLRGISARITNTDPLALPAFRVQGFNVIRIDSPGGGIQGHEAPVIDVNGGTCFLGGVQGVIGNDFATDLSGGLAGSVLAATYANFWGDYQHQWKATALTDAGGAVFVDENRAPVRYRVNPEGAGIPVVPAMSPYAASYGELVPVNTNDGVVTVQLPSGASYGERVTIKDTGGNASNHNITIASTYGDDIEDGLIDEDYGSLTFACMGAGEWWRV